MFGRMMMALPVMLSGCKQPVELNPNDSGISGTDTDTGSNVFDAELDVVALTDRIDTDLQFGLSIPFQNDYGYTVTLSDLEINTSRAAFTKSTGDDFEFGLSPIQFEETTVDGSQLRLANQTVSLADDYLNYNIEIPRNQDGCSVVARGIWSFDDDGTSGDIDVCVDSDLTLSGTFVYLEGDYFFTHSIAPYHHGGLARVGLTVFYDGGALAVTDFDTLETREFSALFKGVRFSEQADVTSTLKQNILSGAVFPMPLE